MRDLEDLSKNFFYDVIIPREQVDKARKAIAQANPSLVANSDFKNLLWNAFAMNAKLLEDGSYQIFNVEYHGDVSMHDVALLGKFANGRIEVRNANLKECYCYEMKDGITKILTEASITFAKEEILEEHLEKIQGDPGDRL